MEYSTRGGPSFAVFAKGGGGVGSTCRSTSVAASLVVFLPVGKAAGGRDQYKTKGLPANGSLGGDWGDLRIDGSTWVYSWDSENDGKRTHFRNTNTFTGSDKIHFQSESSDDGSTWKPGMSGIKQRSR